MPQPQIKHDLNRSGWETTDFPSVCENCLPDNPYIQMLKSDHGLECKLCTRPFTVFTWKADRTSRTKRTNICLTCARLKNCCQCCMLDLSFGLPIAVRDAALKMVAPGPRGDVNREFYAQEHEREIEEGRGGVEAYEKTDEKARDLLRRLANSEPYYKKRRRLEAAGEAKSEGGGEGSASTALTTTTFSPSSSHPAPGPVRKHPNSNRNSNPKSNRNTLSLLAPSPLDLEPPANKKITTLFLTGIEDDMPEHHLRTYFSKHGTIRSLVCSHRAHCAFVNFASRNDAETAAAACAQQGGKCVVAGVPLRVRWGKMKALDSMENEERGGYAREGRDMARAQQQHPTNISGAGASTAPTEEGKGEGAGDVGTIALPPGMETGDEKDRYASLAVY